MHYGNGLCVRIGHDTYHIQLSWYAYQIFSLCYTTLFHMGFASNKNQHDENMVLVQWFGFYGRDVALECR